MSRDRFLAGKIALSPSCADCDLPLWTALRARGESGALVSVILDASDELCVCTPLTPAELMQQARAALAEYVDAWRAYRGDARPVWERTAVLTDGGV